MPTTAQSFRPIHPAELDGGARTTYVVGRAGVKSISHLAGTVTVDLDDGRTIVHTPVGYIIYPAPVPLGSVTPREAAPARGRKP